MSRAANNLDSEIKSSVENLEQLLQKKRAKEDSHVSLWPSCAASGDGYVGCNPAKQGHCPEEEEFDTTFRGTPFANAFAKNTETGEMERCVPGYLVGKPVSEQKRNERKQQSYQERLLRAAYTIEKNFEPLVEAASFQWNTPCENAVTRDQCEILRDAPKYDAAGNLQYAEHNTRCSWRPTEDAEAYWGADEADRGDMCVPRQDQPYKYKQMSRAELDGIRDTVNNLSAGEPNDPMQKMAYEDIKNTEWGLNTPYDTRRMVKTDKPRDLQKALVQLPLLATTQTVAYLNAKHGITGIGSENTWERYVFNKDTPDTWTTDGAPSDTADGTALDKFHKKLAKHMEDNLCDTTSTDYVWSPETLKSEDDLQAQEHGKWLYSFLIPSQDGLDDAGQKYLTQVKHQVAQYAPKTWWRFGAQAALQQTHLINQFLVVKRQVEHELSDYTKLKALELSLTDIIEVEDKNTVYIDTSFIKPLYDENIVEYNSEDMGALDKAQQQELFKGSHKHALELKPEPAGGGTLHQKLKDNALFSFKGIHKSDAKWKETASGQDWNKAKKTAIEALAKKVAILLYKASIVAPYEGPTVAPTVAPDVKGGGGGGDVDVHGTQTTLRALHRRGLAPHIKWRAGVQAEVHVAFMNGDVDKNHAQYQKGIIRALQRLQRLQVAEELKSQMAEELAKNKMHHLTLSYFESLNAENTPEERYRIAISQIPKLVKHKMEEADIVKYTASEIKRRFRNSPGHTMYFNRTITAKEDQAYKTAKAANAEGPVTQQLYAAARFVEEVKAKLPQKEEDESDAALLEKLTQLISDKRLSLRKQLMQGQVPNDISMNKARDFEERFGPGSYVNAFAGTTLKELQRVADIQQKRRRTPA